MSDDFPSDRMDPNVWMRVTEREFLEVLKVRGPHTAKTVMVIEPPITFFWSTYHSGSKAFGAGAFGAIAHEPTEFYLIR